MNEKDIYGKWRYLRIKIRNNGYVKEISVCEWNW